MSSFETINIIGLLDIILEYLPEIDVMKIIRTYPNIKKDGKKIEYKTNNIIFYLESIELFKGGNINIILDLSDNNNKIYKVNRLINLTSLDLEYRSFIDDRDIKTMTNLTFLNLRDNNQITDDGIDSLIGLTSLNIIHCEHITMTAIEKSDKFKIVNSWFQ